MGGRSEKLFLFFGEYDVIGQNSLEERDHESKILAPLAQGLNSYNYGPTSRKLISAKNYNPIGVPMFPQKSRTSILKSK